MVAIGDGAVVRVDIVDQLREVEGELAVGLHGADIPRARIHLAGRARIVTIELHDDQVVSRNVGANGVTPVIVARVVVTMWRGRRRGGGGRGVGGATREDR